MSERANYFKIGLFVIATLALIVLGILFLGADFLFAKPIKAETYINQSVQGLDVGSPVKYRGVQIGSVSRIVFVNEFYREEISTDDTEIRYIMAIMDLRSDAFAGQSLADIRGFLKREIEKGLRVRLVTQGLTGLAYLEIDYLDPERNPPLPIAWEPKYLHIPSAPSTITRFTETAEQLMRAINQWDIQKTIDNFNTLIVSMNRTIDRVDVRKFQDEFIPLMAEMRETNRRILELLNQPELDAVPSDLAQTASGARRIVEQTEEQMQDVLKNFETISTNLAEITGEIDAIMKSERFNVSLDNMAETSEQIKTAAGRMPETFEHLNRTLAHFDRTITAQQENLEAILENLREITENLRDVSRDARRYPSQVLFGEPPPPSRPDRQ